MDINSQEHIKAIAPEVAKAYQLGKEQKNNKAYQILQPLFKAKEIPAHFEEPSGRTLYRYLKNNENKLSSLEKNAGGCLEGIIRLLCLMQTNMTMLCSFRGVPTSDVLLALYNHIQSIFSDLDIKITIIVEHLPNYCVYYYLQGSGSYPCILSYIIKDGFISYAQPFSDMGNDDDVLKKVVNQLDN